MQKEVELQRPFERHAGAYTDLGHLVSAIKHAGDVPKKIVPIPQTRPLRKRSITPEIEQSAPVHRPIIIAKNDEVKKEVMPVAATQGTSSQHQLLEAIWQDHVSNQQASAEENPSGTLAAAAPASGGMQVNAPAMSTQKQEAQGLMSPLVQDAMAMAQGKKSKRRDDRPLEVNEARLSVLVLSATIGQNPKEIEGVDFVSLADESDVVADDRGRFDFDYLLSTSRQTLSGTFSSKGHVPTRVDLPLEVGSFGSLVPLLSTEGLDSLLKKLNLAAPGGFILVDLDQEVIDVEIDRAYQYKAYLDANMKVSEADDHARFALFLGVNPGNVMLRYLTSKRKIVERVALVVADQVLYDLPIIASEKNHSFGLYEMESLSLTPRELMLSGSDIRPFNRKNTAVQDSLNFYTLEFAPSIVGSRSYTEIDHLGTTFYVGHRGEDQLTIPGQGFLNEVLAFHNLDRLERECMVQINIPNEKELLEVVMFGEGGDGPLALDQSYLNRDGTVSMEATEFSTNAFVMGDLQGQVHMRFDYVDGTVDFVNTYCVPGGYLVEQL